jgi:hypothetical protein
VRVLEIRGDMNLLEEALCAERLCELRLEDLQSDIAFVPEVSGEINGGHTTVAQRALDAVSVCERGAQCAQLCVRVTHIVGELRGYHCAKVAVASAASEHFAALAPIECMRRLPSDADDVERGLLSGVVLR